MNDPGTAQGLKLRGLLCLYWLDFKLTYLHKSINNVYVVSWTLLHLDQVTYIIHASGIYAWGGTGLPRGGFKKYCHTKFCQKKQHMI